MRPCSLTRSITLSVGSTAWFPLLLHATIDQRQVWELLGDGEMIHWPVDQLQTAGGLNRWQIGAIVVGGIVVTTLWLAFLGASL